MTVRMELNPATKEGVLDQPPTALVFLDAFCSLRMFNRFGGDR